MSKFYLLFLIIIFTIACNPHSSKLSDALKNSGRNRAELERVLEHYSQNDVDNLKLKAAIFLIENMPGHYSVAGAEINEHIKQIDSICVGIQPYFLPMAYVAPYFHNSLQSAPERKYDIEHITSDFLIKNIDYKFAIKEIVPWGNDIDFDVFCERILPYRDDVEPLNINIYDSLSGSLESIRKEFECLENCKSDVYTLTTEVSGRTFDKTAPRETKAYISLDGYAWSDCITKAYAAMARCKAFAVPGLIDFVPHWGNENNRHYWVDLFSANSRISNLELISSKIMAKVYRKTFSHNPCPLDVDNFVPALFQTPFNKDVTSEYIHTIDVTVEVSKGIKYAYLNVFSDLKWQPIAWAKINAGHAHFSELGKGVVYLPVAYSGREEVTIGYPFLVTNQGEKQTLAPDIKNRQTVRMTRKYPESVLNSRKINDLKGCVLEASHKSSFSDAKVIAEFSDCGGPCYIANVMTHTKYRYWRILKKASNFTLSEVKFRDNNNINIKGDVITNIANRKLNVSYMYDGSHLTCARVMTWIGFDFGEKVSLSDVLIAPHNDENYIYPGDLYELLYHDDRGWVSAGIKEADNYFVEFNHVPTNALFWLRNLTRGKEERPFTYNQGHAQFR